jgi:hypothetical protein
VDVPKYLPNTDGGVLFLSLGGRASTKLKQGAESFAAARPGAFLAGSSVAACRSARLRTPV